MMRLVSVFLFLAMLAPAQRNAIPVIFDTDIGDDIDDALALALILQSPELDLRAVTTVIDDTATRTRLAWKMLRLYNRKDVALATGASEPLLDPVAKEHARQFDLLTAADTVLPRHRRPAADLIVEMLENSREKITLVPVGPLTNIALALKIRPSIKDKIERIVLMGGAFFPPKAEYNIQRDRIAAEIVFRSGVPIVAVGLDVTMKCKLQGADLDRMRTANNPATQFLMKLIGLWQEGKSGQAPTLHDPLAVGALIRASLIETQLGSVHVEIANQPTYGTTTFTPAGAEAASTYVAREVKARDFLDLFVERLSKPPR